MEKKFEVTIRICLYETESEVVVRSPLTGESIVSAFLYDIAGNGRRFRVESASENQATVVGACTEEEIALLSEQLKDFFEFHGLESGLSRWEVKRGGRVPEIRAVFEDGQEKLPELSLRLILFEDWAQKQEVAPAPAFFELLCKRLDWVIDRPSQNPARLELNIQSSKSVYRIWEEGQLILNELGFISRLVEFEVQYLGYREVDEW